MSQTTYRVSGMTCGGCQASLTRALNAALPGLTLDVSHTEGTVVIDGEHDPAVVEATVEDAGFDFAGPA